MSITHLELNDNSLAGPINSFLGLAELKLLDLSSNQMTGSLVHASNLTKLEILKANRNKFSGSVPKSFSSLGIFIVLEYSCFGTIDIFLHDTTHLFSTEKAIIMNIRAGNNGNNFEWHLKDEDNDVLIAADGDYADGHQLNLYLCLTFPRWYSILAGAAMPFPTAATPFPTPPTLTHSPTYPAATPPPTSYDPGRATNKPIPIPTNPPIPFSTPQPTGPPAGKNEAGISFSFDGCKSSIGPNGQDYFYVSEKTDVESNWESYK